MCVLQGDSAVLAEAVAVSVWVRRDGQSGVRGAVGEESAALREDPDGGGQQAATGRALAEQWVARVLPAARVRGGDDGERSDDGG